MEYDIYQRTHKQFHTVFKLQAPLAHFGEKEGNQNNLNTIKVRDLEEQISDVFIYSSNALRGQLRRIGNFSLLTELGIKVSPGVHQFLFCGGMLDGNSGCDLEFDRKVRGLLPSVSFWGGCKAKTLLGKKECQMFESRIKMGNAMLVCFESIEYIYRQFKPLIPNKILKGITQLIETKDKEERQEAIAFLNDNKTIVESDYAILKQEWLPVIQEMLPAYNQCLTSRQTIRSDSLNDNSLASVLDNKTDAVGCQMIVQSWLLGQGNTLYSKWVSNATEIELGYLIKTLLEFSKAPYLGGVSVQGNGLVQVDIYDDEGHLISLNPNEISERAKKWLQSYTEFIEENKTQIIKLLT